MTTDKTTRERARQTTNLPRDGIRAECFMLADGAEECKGKLFVLGGGWDQLLASGFPTQRPHIALPIVLSVPWSATNEEHRLLITLRDEDNRDILPQPVSGTFNVGRPPTAMPGDAQKVPLTIQLGNLSVEREGVYTFRLEVDGQEVARTSFRARKGS
jgi:hypothetical protein